MSQIISGIHESKILTSLDTYNYTVSEAGVHTVSVQLLEVPTSAISIVVKQNSATLITSAVPTAGQQLINVRISANCALNDVLHIQISSSSAQDQGKNAFKAILAITKGAN